VTRRAGGIEAVVIPGDDSGPELVGLTCAVLDTVVARFGRRITWIRRDAGRGAWERHGDNLPDDTITAVRQAGVALKGPTTTGIGTGLRSANIRLRQVLDLFACIRPSRVLPGVPHVRPGINVTSVRENSEDLYAGLELATEPHRRSAQVSALHAAGVTVHPADEVSVRMTSPAAAARLGAVAARLASMAEDRILYVAGSRVLHPVSDGLFIDGVRIAATAQFPAVKVVELDLTDALRRLAAGTLRGVLALSNLYGDIASDVAAASVGGLGVGPGVNLGDDCAIFEATHGSAPRWAGTGLKNMERRKV